MSPHVPEKTGTSHTDKQWKIEGGGREGKGRDRKKTTRHSTQNASSCFTNEIDKLYNPKHDESYSCASNNNYNKTTDNNNRPQSLLVVNSVKFHLTSVKIL